MPARGQKRKRPDSDEAKSSSSSQRHGRSLSALPSQLNPFYAEIEQFEKDHGITHMTQGSESAAFARYLSVQRPGETIRVYADGIWDLFHFGHAKALEQARSVFPNCTLVVGVCSDEDTHRLKGKTVMTALERAESVRHCKWVDEVIPDCPWTLTPEFLQANNIHFIAHDSAPYVDATKSAGSYETGSEEEEEEAKSEIVKAPEVDKDGDDVPGYLDAGDVYYMVKKHKMFLPTERTEGISTTALINRIVIDYDTYIRRNFKRGFNRHELNVSFLREKRVKIAEKLDEVKKSTKDTLDEIKTGLGDFLETNQIAQDFLGLFSGRGRVAAIYKKQKTAFLSIGGSPRGRSPFSWHRGSSDDDDMAYIAAEDFDVTPEEEEE